MEIRASAPHRQTFYWQRFGKVFPGLLRHAGRVTFPEKSSTTDEVAAECSPARAMPATRFRRYPGHWAIPAPGHAGTPSQSTQGL